MKKLLKKWNKLEPNRCFEQCGRFAIKFNNGLVSYCEETEPNYFLKSSILYGVMEAITNKKLFIDFAYTTFMTDHFYVRVSNPEYGHEAYRTEGYASSKDGNFTALILEAYLQYLENSLKSTTLP